MSFGDHTGIWLKLGGPIVRRDSTEQAIAKRIAELCQNFARYLGHFDAEERFAGPSLYFHRRTIERRKELNSALLAIKDERFREYLYATLAAWGLVRMGGVKMHDFARFTQTLHRCATNIEALEGVQIDTLSAPEVASVAEQICNVIGKLDITDATAKIVPGTKALHHLLPELVPPIDREHIGRFFGWQPGRMQDHRQPFIDMFPRFCHIARTVNPSQYVGTGEWRTSRTKALDNAILGYSLAHRT
ncbi:MAG: hypothetical protein ACLFPU_10010 [Dehalococcoidia bacterium]